MTSPAKRSLNFAAACFLAVAVSACAGDLNPVRDVLVVTGLGEARAPAPEFVEATRPEELRYVPIGTATPPRETPAKTPEEIAAMEEELRQVQGDNEARAASARSLSMAPPPEPVRVEDIPELAPDPEPVTRNTDASR